jgi:DNA-binding GntR family transcriptional regulator
MHLSTYIKNDLRARIQAGAALPCRLTLAGLSDFYQVSLMPVRTAVQELIGEQFFHKQENGRFTINPGKRGRKRAGAGDGGVAPPTNWFKVIRDGVIRQSLRGQSTQLRIAATAERYGIGRTLVHSIFHRLAGAGLLEHIPRRGWLVHPFRETDLDAYVEVREVLEFRALELARPHLDAADLQQLLDRNRPGDGKSPTRFDNSLHRYWVDKAQNRYIQDFFERHGAYYAALLDFAAIGDALLAELAGQHRTILELLLRKKWHQAQAALAHDIRRLRPILKDTIQRLEAEGANGNPTASNSTVIRPEQ